VNWRDRAVAQSSSAPENLNTPSLRNTRVITTLKAVEQSHDQRGALTGRERQSLVKQMVYASVHELKSSTGRATGA
jgi:hypothetical protein